MAARFHYNEEALSKWLLSDELPAGGRMESTQRAEQINRHLKECSECQERLERLAVDGLNWEQAASLLRDDPNDLQIDYGAGRPAGSQSAKFLVPSDHPGSIGRFGRYEVKEILGQGGMGLVMRAFDPALNRESAVKVLSPVFATSSAARKRFAREAKSAAAVVHPHIIPIQTVGEHDGIPFLVMPVVEGRSLQDRVRRTGPLSVLETLRIACQIASGLAAAHGSGVIHRDIKPANILLEKSVERVQITDFGLARAVDDADVTRSGVIAGTPQYMSPEQASGGDLDVRSDLFSLGSVMYYMLTGRSPFRAETMVGVINRITTEQPRRLVTIVPEIPDWLEAIVERLLEKSREDRFGSAEEVEKILAERIKWLQNPEHRLIEWKHESRSRKPFRISTKTLKAIQFTLFALVASVIGALLAIAWSNWSDKDTEPGLAGFKEKGEDVAAGSASGRSPVLPSALLDESYLLSSDNPVDLMLLGRVYTLTGRYKESSQSLLRCWNLKDNHDDYWQQLRRTRLLIYWRDLAEKYEPASNSMHAVARALGDGLKLDGPGSFAEQSDFGDRFCDLFAINQVLDQGDITRDIFLALSSENQQQIKNALQIQFGFSVSFQDGHQEDPSQSRVDVAKFRDEFQELLATQQAEVEELEREPAKVVARKLRAILQPELYFLSMVTDVDRRMMEKIKHDVEARLDENILLGNGRGNEVDASEIWQNVMLDGYLKLGEDPYLRIQKDLMAAVETYGHQEQVATYKEVLERRLAFRRKAKAARVVRLYDSYLSFSDTQRQMVTDQLLDWPQMDSLYTTIRSFDSHFAPWLSNDMAEGMFTSEQIENLDGMTRSIWPLVVSTVDRNMVSKVAEQPEDTLMYQLIGVLSQSVGTDQAMWTEFYNGRSVQGEAERNGWAEKSSIYKKIFSRCVDQKLLQLQSIVELTDEQVREMKSAADLDMKRLISSITGVYLEKVDDNDDEPLDIYGKERYDMVDELKVMFSNKSVLFGPDSVFYRTFVESLTAEQLKTFKTAEKRRLDQVVKERIQLVLAMIDYKVPLTAEQSAQLTELLIHATSKDDMTSNYWSAIVLFRISKLSGAELGQVLTESQVEALRRVTTFSPIQVRRQLNIDAIAR